MRPILLAVTLVVTASLGLLAQQPGPAGLRTSLDRLEQALRHQDMAVLTPVLDPGFRAGGFTGDLALSIIKTVVSAGKVVPDAIEVESVSAVGENFKVVASFRSSAGARSYDLIVGKDARFIEINLMKVQATSEQRMVGEAPPSSQAASTPTNPALRAELLGMLEEDQRHRRERAESMKPGATADADRVHRIDVEQAAMDEANVRKLVTILDNGGWPTAAAVGADASRAAFLVLQHSPLEVQEQYLATARSAAAAGELERSNLAFLEDRVLMRRGKNQIYGTQLRSNPATHKMELWPIDDEPNVDARRKAVGLEPLADYLRRFGLISRPGGA